MDIEYLLFTRLIDLVKGDRMSKIRGQFAFMCIIHQYGGYPNLQGDISNASLFEELDGYSRNIMGG